MSKRWMWLGALVASVLVTAGPQAAGGRDLITAIALGTDVHNRIAQSVDIPEIGRAHV